MFVSPSVTVKKGSMGKSEIEMCGVTGMRKVCYNKISN